MLTAHINAEHREFYEKLSQEPRFTNADRVNPKPELGELIRGGECEMVEFKSTLRTNLHTNEFDKAITFSVVKTIAGFVNREGGTVLVGVADDGKVIWVDADKFRNQDDCRLFLDDTIGRHLGNIANTLVDYSFQAHDGKHVLVVACKKAKSPVFCKRDNDEILFVRTGGASTRELNGSEIATYVSENFRRE